MRKNKEIKNSSVKMGLGRQKNISVIIILGILILIITAGLIFTFSKLFETEDYYVAAEQIPINSKITKEKLVAVSVPKGSAPPTALTADKINENTFAQYTLEKSEVVTSGNTGNKSDRHAGIPDDWVITTITIPIQDAANGVIVPGDYFDIIKIHDGYAEYLALDALALDVATVNGVQTEQKDDTVKTKESGEGLVYTLGLPPKLAAEVLHQVSTEGAVKFVRSPLSVKYDPMARDINELNKELKFDVADLEDLRGDTDFSRTPIHRTAKGEPITRAICEANDKLSDDKKDSSVTDVCGPKGSKQRETVPKNYPASPNNETTKTSKK